jgi:hypothetical protein
MINWFRTQGEVSAGAVGPEQQDSSGDQKILWLSHLRSHGNSCITRRDAFLKPESPTDSAEETKLGRKVNSKSFLEASNTFRSCAGHVFYNIGATAP